MAPTSEPAEVTLASPATPEDSAAAAAFGVGTAPTDPDRWQFERRLGRLELRSPRAEGPMRLEVCVSGGARGQRLRTVRRGDPLPRAIGMGKSGIPPTVVDATAGLCRDAMSLGHLGCPVTAVERVPALALFGHWSIASAGLAERVRVVCAEATAWLEALAAGQEPAVVYLDPMFTARGKAQVKKEMQVCRLLAGSDPDADRLLAAARRLARSRVVVKRHPDHPPLGPDVAFSVDSERIRFDVYLTP